MGLNGITSIAAATDGRRPLGALFDIADRVTDGRPYDYGVVVYSRRHAGTAGPVEQPNVCWTATAAHWLSPRPRRASILELGGLLERGADQCVLRRQQWQRVVRDGATRATAGDLPTGARDVHVRPVISGCVLGRRTIPLRPTHRHDAALCGERVLVWGAAVNTDALGTRQALVGLVRTTNGTRGSSRRADRSATLEP